MKKTSIIHDGSEKTSDLSKIIFYLLIGQVKEALKKQRNGIVFLVLTIILAIATVILFMNEDQVLKENLQILLIPGIFFTLIMTVVSFVNAQPKARITRIGQFHLPLTRMKFQNGSILVDRSGIIKNSVFEFTNLSDDNIRSANEHFLTLKNLVKKMPSLLSGGEMMDLPNQNADFKKHNLKMYREEVVYHNMNLELEKIFTETEDYKVGIPAFRNNPELISRLEQMSDDKPEYLLEKIEHKTIADQIHRVDGIVEMYEGKAVKAIDIDDLCLSLMGLILTSMPRIDYVMNKSLNSITVPGTYLFLDRVDKTSYNYYCPSCNAKLIDHILNAEYKHSGEKDNRVVFPMNTRMELVDLELFLWKCPLCTTETREPYPRHKMEDELFTPVYDKLYEEHFKDRLNIYNQINDQKREYAEKAEVQFHQVLRESRTKRDELKSKIRTIQSDMSSDEVAIQSLNDLLVKYKRIAVEKSREIQADLANSKREIEIENERSKKRIDDAVAKAKKDVDKSTKKYASLEREDQKKRDEVQKQIAQNTKRTTEAIEDTNRIILGFRPRKNYNRRKPK